MKPGIIFSDTDVTKADLSYDSRKQKMTVDLDPIIKHAQVVPMNAGTVISDMGSGGFYHKLLCDEVLFRTEHHMPFKPKVEAYFYVTKAGNPPGSTTPVNGTTIGSYYKNSLPIIYNIMGYGDEGVFIKVDDVYLTVRHQVYSWDSDSMFYGVGSYCEFNFRYLVTNLPDISEPVT